MSLITGIYKALHILYSKDYANAWLGLPNQRLTLSGKSPLDYMLQGGIEAMFALRKMLDADRSGQFGDATAEQKALAEAIVRKMVKL